MAPSPAWLLLISTFMFIGSFLAGNIPLALQFSEEKLNLLSTFGSGLLVGTAFIVILPEGVETLYAVQSAMVKLDGEGAPQAVKEEEQSWHKEDHSHFHRRLDDHLHQAWRPDPDPENEASNEQKSNEHELHEEKEVAEEKNEEKSATPSKTHHDNHGHAHEAPAFDAASYIGPSLILGFLFMLLIDQCGPNIHSHDHSHHHVSVADLKDGLPPPVQGGSGGSQKRMAATIGLIVHAAADGIAMGAASASDQSSLEFIVFMAIMLHKAPSAFGLATHLLHEGNSRRTIRQHLMAFSLAAPIAAIITFILLSQTGWDDPIGMRKWTGLLLLFSAGTFIYVATMHILPEVITDGPRGKEPLSPS
ncbi:hypothetical protein HDU97_001192, partial [Phlyctochytrium planicorne]